MDTTHKSMMFMLRYALEVLYNTVHMLLSHYPNPPHQPPPNRFAVNFKARLSYNL